MNRTGESAFRDDDLERRGMPARPHEPAAVR